ncbi:MAG: M48 family metallopeptidase [Chloroflexi bacterium]|nr:M48 family metallopeptidase [Chloroflexota bacterium]MBM3174732.1 M48 family metallopeptidase [Chloroflexota bacterium]MBM4449999.1 M48 family metallopeptidase [Chloroflexota bacterium]
MQFQESLLDSERQRLAREYDSISRRLSFAEMGVVGALLLALVFGGISAWVGHLLNFPQPWASALYFLGLVILCGVLTLPLTYYQGFVLSHRYGLSKQTVGDWVTDGLKATGIGLLLGVLIILVIYLFIDRFEDTWWLWAAGALFLFTVLLTRLTPTLLLPLFFELEPLGNIDLKQRLTELAKKAKTDICGIYTMNLSSKNTTANAMLAGLGGTRRIILSDTLIDQYTPEEIEVVMAHEMGHHLHKDIPKLIAVQAVTFVAAFYLGNLALKAGVMPFGLRGISDVTGLPLLALVMAVFGLLTTPLVNAFSRYVEKSADRAALKLTANPAAFVTAMTKLTDQNLSVANPSRLVELWFYDHPPYVRRIELAQDFYKAISQGEDK